MIGMRIYEVYYNAENPILLSQPTIGNVYHNTYNYLLGSTIRGAILTYLRMNKFGIDEEMINPSIIFHPAYLVKDGYIYKPAHCLVYECKICKKADYPFVTINPYDSNYISIDPSNRLHIDNIPPIRCNKGHPFALKPIGGELIAVKDGKILDKYNDKYTLFDSVGINRITGSSEVGMIYTYVASLQKQYRGLIVTKDNCKLDISKLNNAVISIGKGINRGFGTVKIKIKEIDKNAIIKRYDKLNGKQVVLKALSPIFKLNINKDGLVTTANFKIKSNSCHVLSNGSTKLSGFSLFSNTPKVKLNALKEGTLLIINNIEHEDLADIELNGIGDISCAGFNIVEVLNHDLPY